jgi:serine/threonine protein kinase
LNHPCVVRILGWQPQIGNESAEIRTEIAKNGSLKTILEQVRCGGAVDFWHSTGKGILICGIALGMQFVHSKGVTHRDLKPSNILVNGYGEAVISDFGLGRFEGESYTPEGGTVQYAAPELFSEEPKLIPGAKKPEKPFAILASVDIFSFGSLMHEILTGTPVFSASDPPLAIVKKITDGERPPVPDNCGSLMQQLIPRCWSMMPKDRPTFAQVVQEFKAAGFQHFPGANLVRLSQYVTTIEDWEAVECQSG